MPDPNEKTIGGNSGTTGSTEKMIGGNQSASAAGDGTIPGRDATVNNENKTAPPPPQSSTSTFGADLDLKGKLRNATLQGGLTDIPDDFNSSGGSWETINANDDPFKVLYFDYSKYQKITDTMVAANHEKLYNFWNGKRLLTGNIREKAEDRYGKRTIDESTKKLDTAKNKLITKEGRELYFKELDGKRIAGGLQAIAQFIKFVLEDGDCTRERGIQIIELGKESGLHENEVRNHLMQTLNAKGFAPKPGLNSPDFLNNEWMTATARAAKEARRIPDIFVLDKKVTSLKEAGEVLYNHAATAKTDYLHNASYMIGDITKLENSGKAREYEKLMNAEPDMDKRFLKVVYHLNPTLPYKIYNQSFANISELFQKTALDFGLFLAASNDYKKGHIHIWLQETDTASAAKLSSGFDYTSFLNFVFIINPSHGIYLGQEKFGTPEQLIAKAKTDKAYWPKITEAMQAGVLPAWFAGIGRQDWLKQYNEKLHKFIDDNLYTDDEKKLMSAQTLIQIIDASVAKPVIKVSPERIQLLALEGSKAVRQKIYVQLSGFGFVKVRLSLKQATDGIQLINNTAAFFSLADNTSTEFFLQIDPLKLLKDKTYTLEIEIQTAFQNITIPVEIKVVFPAKAYYLSMVKYAVFGAFLFGITRFIIGSIAQTGDWLSTVNRARPYSYRNFLPDNYFSYFIVLVLLIGSLAGSVFLIRKIEKI